MEIKRNTIQRALVLETVRKLKCHATAEEVYQAVVAESPHISKGTVYRNLNWLAQSGALRRVEIPGGADRFDHCPDAHYHARCLGCGRIFDVDMDYMQGLEKQVRDARGFRFSGHDILFRGLCTDCAECATDSAECATDSAECALS